MNLGQWIGLLAVVISFYVLWQIRQVLLLVFVAVVLATALNRLARWLQSKRVPRLLAVLLSVGILASAITGFFLLIVPPFAAEFQELTTTKFPQVLALVSDWQNQLRSRLPAQLLPYIPDVDSLVQQLQPFLNRLLGGSVAVFSGSLGVVLNLLLVLVLTIMLLVNPQAYRKAFLRLFPSFYRRRADGILSECEVSLGAWLGGAFISMSVIAILSWLGLTILGIRLAIASGVLAGLLNFIPNIGPTLSVVLPMGIALLDAPWKSVFVLALYIIIQQFESNLLTPYIMSQQVSLLPAVTLLSQLVFTTAFGSLGLLMSIPLTVVAQVWIKEALIKDILDKWGSDNKNDVEIVVVADSAELPESSKLPAVATKTGDNPNGDDVTDKT
ncbi:AI-2E family transporter [Microcoleus sp. FACHB-831]|nr:AI-2E family transporter [Microcoleus sp. FACHB-831]